MQQKHLSSPILLGLAPLQPPFLLRYYSCRHTHPVHGISAKPQTMESVIYYAQYRTVPICCIFVTLFLCSYLGSPMRHAPEGSPIGCSARSATPESTSSSSGLGIPSTVSHSFLKYIFTEVPPALLMCCVLWCGHWSQLEIVISSMEQPWASSHKRHPRCHVVSYIWLLISNTNVKRKDISMAFRSSVWTDTYQSLLWQGLQKSSWHLLKFSQ